MKIKLDENLPHSAVRLLERAVKGVAAEVDLDQLRSCVAVWRDGGVPTAV